VKRNIEVEFQLTADELAKAFWDLDGDQQAMFFNALGHYPKLIFQLQFVSESEYLRSEGRGAMANIGEYSK
jgi:hypothetical protein